jgi:hypothetical protein
MANLETRASAERRASLYQAECQCIGCVVSIVEDAVAQSDLVLPPPLRPGDIVYSLFTLAIGTETVQVNFSDVIDNLAIANPRVVTRHAFHALLDGFGWRPLSTEWDYQATFDRISKEVFADECQLAKSVG